MNIQEAIKQLQTEHDLIANEHELDGSQFAPALLEALAMAIEVMQGDGDTISRKQAIEAIYNTYDKYGRTAKVEEFASTIKWLPSAQPEVIRCKDCKYSEHWYKDKTRCFLWHETGIDVFEDGYCNYAKRRTDADMRGEQDEID